MDVEQCAGFESVVFVVVYGPGQDRDGIEERRNESRQDVTRRRQNTLAAPYTRGVPVDLQRSSSTAVRCCLGVSRLLQVVQQLLRHGADLHNLDNNAAKPLDFRKYFEERRDDIMYAVQDILEYR